MLVLGFGKFGLLAWSFKDKKTCFNFFYFETVVQLLGHLQPYRIDSERGDIALALWMLSTLLNFVLLYTNFIASLCLSLASLLVMRSVQIYAFGVPEKLTAFILTNLAALAWLTIAQGSVHYLVVRNSREAFIGHRPTILN